MKWECTSSINIWSVWCVWCVDRFDSPAMDVTEMTAEGKGPSKRDAKHNAAEAMAYVLLPEVWFLRYDTWNFFFEICFPVFVHATLDTPSSAAVELHGLAMFVSYTAVCVNHIVEKVANSAAFLANSTAFLLIFAHFCSCLFCWWLLIFMRPYCC